MSKQIDNGGSVTADIVSERYISGIGMLEEKVKPVGGLSIRDYFAAAALSGLCANSELFKSFAGLRPEFLKHMSVDECDRFEHRVISMSAKSMADAMIEARKENGQP